MIRMLLFLCCFISFWMVVIFLGLIEVILNFWVLLVFS